MRALWELELQFLELCRLIIREIVIGLAFIGYGFLVALIWLAILKSSGFCHFADMPWSSEFSHDVRIDFDFYSNWLAFSDIF
jgi:hypothetical protein